jgi:broad specificity phosphatase PhoE
MERRMTAVLIRHASADSAGLLAGRMRGMALNQKGRAEAERLAVAARRFGIAAVYSSPRERALETAVALGSAIGLTPLVDESFDELDYGEWSGKRISDMDSSGDARWRAFNRRRAIVRPPLGEWMIEAQIRAVLRLRSLAAIHFRATVGIVSHADVIRAVVAYYCGVSFDNILRITISPASITVLECDQFGGVITGLNLGCIQS